MSMSSYCKATLKVRTALLSAKRKEQGHRMGPPFQARHDGTKVWQVSRQGNKVGLLTEDDHINPIWDELPPQALRHALKGMLRSTIGSR